MAYFQGNRRSQDRTLRKRLLHSLSPIRDHRRSRHRRGRVRGGDDGDGPRARSSGKRGSS